MVQGETLAQERYRKELQKRTISQPSFYTEQKRTEYKTFTKDYIQPIAEPTIRAYQQYARETSYHRYMMDLGLEPKPQLPSPSQMMLQQKQKTPFNIFDKRYAQQSEFSAGAIRAGEGFVSFITGRPTASETIQPEYPQSYLTGRVIGEVAIAYALGKFLEPITKPAFQWVGKQVTSTGSYQRWMAMHTKQLTDSYEAAAKAGKLWSSTWQERFIMKITGFHPHLARGETLIGTAERVIGMRGEKAIIEPFTFSEELASKGWSLTESPRMGGVMVAKTPFDLAPYRTNVSALIGRMPIGYLSGEYAKGFKAWTRTGEPHKPPSTPLEAMRQAGLTPYVSQSQITRLGIHPYTPFRTAIRTGKGASGYAQILQTGIGLGVVHAPKRLTRKARNRMFTEEDISSVLITRLRAATFPKEKTKARNRLFVSSKVRASTKGRSRLEQQLQQKQKTRQLLTVPTIPIQRSVMTKPPITPPLLTFPSARQSRLYKSLYGRWFKKRHPISTPSELASALGLTKRRRRK